MKKVITGGIVIDPSINLDGPSDVLISNGIIEAVGSPGAFTEIDDALVINAKDSWVVPGFIDLHVHLREPGFEWKETVATGSRAAVSGGYTTICCMPNTSPVNDCIEVSAFIQKKSEIAGFARVRPIGSVSRALEGKELSPLSELAHAGCVAFSDDGEPVWHSGLMRRALEWCRMLGIRISCHEEDKCLSCRGSMNESPLSMRMGLRGVPTVAEDVMVARDIELARYTGGKIHICHISSARSVELVRRAKNDGIDVTAEVTPHHLILSEDAVAGYDTNNKMSPPLRTEEEIEALWNGLMDGTIDAIASDHAPHERDSKLVEFEAATVGILGLQTSLPLLLEYVHSGKLSRSAFVALGSVNPAKTFSLDAGSLRKGMPADVCIIDPEHRWAFSHDMVQSLSFNSPFIERQFRGCARTVIVGGEVKMNDGEIL